MGKKNIPIFSKTSLIIILAAYNGEAYIKEQINSIQAQSVSNWILLVRDDGSTDNTVDIVKRLMEKDPRIQIINNEKRHHPLGPAGNFAALINRAFDFDPDYIAFADQDDVWIENKLLHQLRTMKSIETVKGKEVPVLICSDLELVDQAMQPIHPSFIQYQNIKDPTQPHLTTLLVQNHVVGCTMLANRSLIDVAYPIPRKVYMHDWWIALCAASTGILYYIHQPMVRYRLHGLNTAGAGGFKTAFNPLRLKWFRTLIKLNRMFAAAIEQWTSLKDRLQKLSKHSHSDPCLNKNLNLLSNLLSINEFPTPKRMFKLYQGGVSGQNWIMTVAFYGLMLYRQWSFFFINIKTNKP